MKVSVKVFPSAMGDRLASGAFDANRGKEVAVPGADGRQVTGVLRSAVVAEDGTFATLMLEIADDSLPQVRALGQYSHIVTTADGAPMYDEVGRLLEFGSLKAAEIQRDMLALDRERVEGELRTKLKADLGGT